jgi:signal transduction histidine kinase
VSEHDRQRSNRSSPELAAAFVRGRLAVDHELSRELVNTVNHHLRTPLTAILGNAELLIDQVPRLPTEMHQSLGCVLRSGWRLNDVVTGICDLIDIASIDPDTVGEVDVAHLLAEEVATFQDRAARRGVQVLVPSNTGAECVADSRRLRRAVHELLDNALTFAPDQTTVSVTATTTATGVRIAVADNGPGIDLADRGRLTKPFETGTPSRASASGRGMGLALASAVAASHRGRLALSEGPGGGLCACLELPANFMQPVDAPTTD